ncbi:MAG: hypothetical protein AAGN35_10250 [Bacteroidota bacterium]
MYIGIQHIKGIRNGDLEKLKDAGIYEYEQLAELVHNRIALQKLHQETAIGSVWLYRYAKLALAVRQLHHEFSRRVTGGYFVFVEGDPYDLAEEEDPACIWIVNEPQQPKPRLPAAKETEREGRILPRHVWVR